MKKLITLLVSVFLFSTFSFSQETELTNYEKYRMEQERIQYGTQEETVFTVVEDMPTFKGKDADEFRKYIAQNVKYPKEAAENNIQGKVFVQFVVNKDGNVSNVEIVEGVNEYLDAESIRVVESSPKWKAGQQNGENVNVQFTFPINFVLQENDEQQTTVINNYYIDNDYDWEFRMNRRLYFSHSYYNPYYYSYSYYNPYYYGGYYGYNYYDSYYYGGYYGSYYPYYGYNHNHHNYYNYSYNRYNNSRYYVSSSLGRTRNYNNPYYSKTYSSGYVTPNTYSKKNNVAVRPNTVSRTSSSNRTVSTSTRSTSPYTRVLKDGNTQTTRTYTPTYTKPRTSSTNNYNRGTQTNRGTTTVTRPSSTSRSSSSYSRPTSTSRSSSSYSRPTSTSRSSSSYSRPASSSSSSRSTSSSYSRSSTPSRSPSYSSPSRSSSSGSYSRPSSSSSRSYSTPSRSSGSSSSRSSSGGKK